MNLADVDFAILAKEWLALESERATIWEEWNRNLYLEGDRHLKDLLDENDKKQKDFINALPCPGLQFFDILIELGIVSKHLKLSLIAKGAI